jgi:hypothetical protein
MRIDDLLLRIHHDGDDGILAIGVRIRARRESNRRATGFPQSIRFTNPWKTLQNE